MKTKSNSILKYILFYYSYVIKQLFMNKIFIKNFINLYKNIIYHIYSRIYMFRIENQKNNQVN